MHSYAFTQIFWSENETKWSRCFMTTSWSFCLLCKNQNRKLLFLFFMTKSEVTRQVTIIVKVYHRVCWPSAGKHPSDPVSSAECLACQTLPCVFYIWIYVVCWRSCAYKDDCQSYIRAGKCLEYKHYRSIKAVADWINWRHKVRYRQPLEGNCLKKGSDIWTPLLLGFTIYLNMGSLRLR